MTKKCTICEKEFYTKTTGIYCSLDCRTIGERQKKQSYYRGIRRTIQCKSCGKYFIVTKKQKLYCSELCKQQKPKHIIACFYCKKPFEKKRNKKYCSYICRQKMQWQKTDEANQRKSKEMRRITVHTCSICGKAFKGRKNQKYCSRLCVRKNRSKIYFEKRESLKPFTKNCKQCGIVFITVSKTKQYCSNQCRKVHYQLAFALENKKRNIEKNSKKPTMGIQEIERIGRWIGKGYGDYFKEREKEKKEGEKTHYAVLVCDETNEVKLFSVNKINELKEKVTDVWDNPYQIRGRLWTDNLKKAEKMLALLCQLGYHERKQK